MLPSRQSAQISGIPTVAATTSTMAQLVATGTFSHFRNNEIKSFLMSSQLDLKMISFYYYSLFSLILNLDSVISCYY